MYLDREVLEYTRSLLTELKSCLEKASKSTDVLRPVLLVEVERNATNEVVDVLTRSMKHLAATNAVSCIMIMIEAYAALTLKPV
jgi:hypothetical protein